MKKNKPLFTLSLLIVLSMIVRVFTFSVVDDPKTSKTTPTFSDKYYVFSLAMPATMDFAGERVPMEQFDVRERLDRELTVNTYWQSQTLLMHKRANRWFPVIVPILKRNGIPEDFRFLALAESGFLNSKSPAGAAGFWQFLDKTAETYGLKVDEEVDERYNVEKATDAACRYLKEAYKLLGSWSLVAGSYNMGLSGIQKQIDRQKVRSYYDLLLNDETFRYVFRILALKEVILHPQKYGFNFRKTDLYSPFQYTIVRIDTSINDLASFAIANGTNYKYLKILNPWLRDNMLTVKPGHHYDIKILKPGFDATVDSETLKYVDANENSTPLLKEPLSETTAERIAEISPKASPTVNRKIHKVKDGETLQSIARQYEINVKDLKRLNKLKTASIKKGQELIIDVDEEEIEIDE